MNNSIQPYLKEELGLAVVKFSKGLEVGSIEGKVTIGEGQPLGLGVRPKSLNYKYEGMIGPYISLPLDYGRLSKPQSLQPPEISAEVYISGVIPVATVKCSEKDMESGTARSSALPLNPDIEEMVYRIISSAVVKHCYSSGSI